MDWEAFYNAFRTPDFIPGFEIENRLGGGAFGDVYKARRTSIGKAYAIKFLKVEGDEQRVAVERELEQVRHLATIDHPNLVSIEDLGMAMGVPYVVMGYAGDETLAKRLRAGELSAREALGVFTQVARGVLALHDRRLVHFDLKPSNIFLHGDTARVGDYGLSKLIDRGRMTLSYGRGTPMYMAPEILRTRADHRADIYSLGVILYESLTGRVPYAPDDIGGLVLRDHDDPPEFPEGFPEVAKPVCESCLHLDPDDRVDSVEELLKLLGQSSRPGDSVHFALPPEVAARTVPAAVPVERARPEPLPSTPEPAGSSLLDGGFRVPSTAARGETPAARALALVSELRSEREAQARASATRPRLHVIPVPPRVTGGLGRTLYETARVGFDVFVASILAVFGSIAAAFRWTVDRLVRDTGGGLALRAARFALFITLMAGVGFGAALLGLFVLFLTSGSS